MDGAQLTGDDGYNRPGTEHHEVESMRRTRRVVLSATSATSAAFFVAVSAVAPADACTSDDRARTQETYSAPLRTAIAELPEATENNEGYDRDLFNHWIDADDDGCNTRYEVLIEEADDPPEVGEGCYLTGGRWFSYYDQVSWYDTSDIDIDHMVPLAEAWGSGARDWTDDQREAFANDIDDYRTLVGVTDNVNQEKSDQDPAEWMPDYEKCRYIFEFVSVKIRWRLTVDSTEKAAMAALADENECSDDVITVERAL